MRKEVDAKFKAIDLTTPVNEAFYEKTLLKLPDGYVTKHSVESNLRVALFYVLAWFDAQGTVVVNGCVEDSATAEISRAQLWQWIHHRVPLDAVKGKPSCAYKHVNAEYVVKIEMFVLGNWLRLTLYNEYCSLVRDLLLAIAREEMQQSSVPLKNLVAGINLVFRVVTMRSPPPFMTTFLLEQEPLTKSLER